MCEMHETGEMPKEYNMLEAVVSTLEGMDEGLSSHYKEVEGVGFVLETKPFVTDAVSYGNVDTHGYKSTLNKLRAENKTNVNATEALEAYKAFGSVEDIQGIKDQLGTAGLKSDAAVEAVTAQFQTKLDALNEANTSMKAQYEGANHAREVTALMNAKSADITDGAGAHSYFEGIIKGMTKVGADGKIVVVDSLGNEVSSREPTNMGPMGLDELWNTLKADPIHGFALKPSGASGAGTKGASGGGATVGAITDGAGWNAATQDQRLALYNSNPTKAETLAKAGAAL